MEARMEKYIEELGKAYQTVKDDASLTEEIREKKLDALRETARSIDPHWLYT